MSLTRSCAELAWASFGGGAAALRPLTVLAVAGAAGALANPANEIDVVTLPPVVLRTAEDITGSGWAVAYDTTQGRSVVRAVSQIYPTHPDDWGKTGGTALTASTDDGKTWSAATYNHPIPNMVDMWQDQLRDGTLVTFGLGEVPPPAAVKELGSGIPPKSRHLWWTSADQGRTWRKGTAEIESAREFGIIARPLPRIFQEADGTVFMPGYSWDAKGYQALLFRSGDNGRNWTVASSIATSASLRAAGITTSSRYLETMVARVADGSMFAVMRTGSNAASPIAVARSNDRGATWAPPEILRVGPQRRVVDGKLPTLCLLPNGALVLLTSHIRNHTRIYVSPDGSGREWTDGYAVTSQTTGNVSMVGIDFDRILVFTSGYPVEYPGPDGRGVRTDKTEANWITSREVRITRRGLERIDLRSKVRSGAASVQSDLRATSRINPATGVAGALDGSILYSNAAQSAGGKREGHYTLTLDRPYAIAGIAVALKIGEPESAKIYLSKDGRNWGSPIIEHRDAIHYTTATTPLQQETEAQHVRVELSAPRGPAVLGEIALYTRAAAGAAPGTPANVVVEAPGRGAVDLSWRAPTGAAPVDHYLITPRLVRPTEAVMLDFDYAPIRIAGTATNFRLERVAARGATYRFSVTAVGRDGGASTPAWSQDLVVASIAPGVSR